MPNIWKFVIALLGLTLITAFSALFSLPDENLKLIACDVGQGDAFLAVYKNNQILIDGGPDRKVLDCLAKYIPFWDKNIEVVVLTHPQDDHYGGLIDVFRSYNVDTFVANGVDSSTQGYQLLKNIVGGSSARVVNPIEDTSIRLGLLHLDILNPSDKLIAENNSSTQSGVLGAYTTNRDLNDFSVVATLSLGEFDALLTGDIGPEISNLVAEKMDQKTNQSIEYLKVPHHGSKNGLSLKLLETITPDLAVISVGNKNRYGHPHLEIIKMLEENGVQIFRTDEVGDVILESDGQNYWIKK